MRRRLAQSLTNRLLREDRPGGWFTAKLRTALSRWGGDPPVEAIIAGQMLRLPLSHELPHYRKRFPSYCENLGQLAGLVAAAGGGTMIDVGANVGDSAAIVKAHAPGMAVLCVDADPTYVQLLHTNTARWPDVHVAAPVLLAERTQVMAGSMTGLGGTSHFHGGSDSLAHAVCLDDLLVEYSQFDSPALIKSDTDGFEDRVLRGAEDTLRRARPVLFLEYDPRMLSRAGSSGLEMLRWLESLGYERLALYDNFGMLLLRCPLVDRVMLADLHAYVAGGRGAFPYYDVVVTRSEHAEIMEALTM